MREMQQLAACSGSKRDRCGADTASVHGTGAHQLIQIFKITLIAFSIKHAEALSQSTANTNRIISCHHLSAFKCGFV